ncbi:MAG: NHLP bacteriocin system secretion protein [Gloeocapsa sp. DLM2.Bin57]|nr:MAG: NHLP bacteriocin system secretion protein [Gloeocapsa sp. DLM2.Bin57]
MFNRQKPKLFREKTSKRISSPEQLDQLMEVIKPKDWLWLSTLGALVLGILLWSVFGVIDSTVMGLGILSSPQPIIPIEAEATGQLREIKVKIGDTVQPGDVIARIEQPELKLQLAEEQQNLIILEQQFQKENELIDREQSIQLADIEFKIESNKQLISQIQGLQATLSQSNQLSIESQRAELNERLSALSDLNKYLKEALEAQQKLFDQGLITETVFLQAQQQYLQNRDQIFLVRTNLTQLEAQEASFLQQFAENQNDLIELESSIRKLEADKTQLNLKNLQTLNQQIQQKQEILNKIAALEEQLEIQGQVISRKSGKILSIEASIGEILNPGTPVAILQESSGTEEDSNLKAILYFKTGEGKRVELGMMAEITPSVVKKDRFGGIIGTVSEVSPFPVSAAEATTTIGNSQLAQTVVDQERNIQVYVELKTEPKNFSGYQWSSGAGPQLSITQGTTATGTVVVEQRAPITYVIPLLRSITGTNQ